MGKALRLIKWAILAAALVAIDQATKYAAAAYLQGRPVVDVIGDFVTLQYVQNSGAFLGLGSTLTGAWWWLLLVVVPVAMTVAVVAYVIVKKAHEPFFHWLTVFFVAGGVGNLIDRIRFRSVIDFLNFGIGPSFRTGIMNVADLYIAVCVVMVLVRMAQDRSFMSKTPPSDASSGPPEAGS